MNRTRTHPAVVRYALFLYFSSRCLRLASRCLSPVIKRSHVAIWKWVQRYASCADRFRTDRCAVRRIFVDETLVRIDGHKYWLWVAYEPRLDVCLSMHLSRERTIFVCYHFFQQLRRRYGRKPVYTDGAHWYNEACRWLRLPHQVYGTKWKNMFAARGFLLALHVPASFAKDKNKLLRTLYRLGKDFDVRDRWTFLNELERLGYH